MLEYKNMIELQGFVGRVYNYGSGDIRCVRFSVCTRQKITRNDGKHLMEVTWHNVVAWNSNIENFEEVASMTKGSAVHVKGKFITQNYVDKDNVTHTTGEVNASSVEIIPKESLSTETASK